MTHLTWEQLNDYADGAMSATARTLSSNHLDSCAECRETLARLRSLLASAKAAPASIEPPAEAWGDIKEMIEGGKVIPLPGTLRSIPYSRWTLVSAAMLLVIASSTITLLVTGREWGVRVPPGTLLAPQMGRGGSAATLPASFIEEERGYLNTVSELTSTLNKTRNKLTPETVQAVEHSLKVIDDAIAEAREALARDPANGMLRDFLTKHYEQKVDLLRRVSGRAT